MIPHDFRPRPHRRADRAHDIVGAIGLICGISVLLWMLIGVALAFAAGRLG